MLTIADALGNFCSKNTKTKKKIISVLNRKLKWLAATFVIFCYCLRPEADNLCDFEMFFKKRGEKFAFKNGRNRWL